MDDYSSKPLVSRFTVRRLYGYKDVELTFSAAAKIVIAENGTGKTTILNMLDAFLNRRLSRLMRFEFHSIECEVGSGEPLVLTKEDIASSPQVMLPPSMREVIEESGLNADELVEWAARDSEEVPLSEIRSHPYFERLYRNSSMDIEETREFVADIARRSHEGVPGKVQKILSEIKLKLGPTQILYLPTYRRIELASARSFSDSANSRFTRVSRSRYPPGKIVGGPQMYFGLADVEQKLKELTEEIGRRSNQGYRTTSATILDDLLTRSTLSSSEYQLPEIETLQLFFSRVSRPAEAKARLETLENLYHSGKIKGGENDLLRYFLHKLASVANETKDIEQRLEQFANVLNVYLKTSSEGKEFRYDPQLTRVSVRNLWTGKEIQLEALSSGEKQVISLFAHLYLDTDPKFVLIDEPELSLSMDWQKLLLPDVAKAPSCRQLLAITHSPFIFENELDPYAEELHITRFALG